MEENKNLCPQCGSEMISIYEKPALNLTCSKCGCKIATTKWEDIDLDDTIYSIILKPSNDLNNTKIKFISKKTGLNYIQSKDLLLKGGIMAQYNAIETKNILNNLNAIQLDYDINPKFPY